MRYDLLMRDIAIVILAAGSARRFGAAKLAQPYAGRALLQHALTAACDCNPGEVVLVTGDYADELAPLAADYAVRVVHNVDHARGMGNSIATGIGALTRPAAAAILLPGDLPLIRAAHLAELVDAWRTTECDAVASAYAGTRGPPVLFSAAWFAHLRALDGDRGARALLDDSNLDTASVDCPAAAFDVDSECDLASLQRRQSRRAK